ncbi:hypothetical protein ACCO45_002487 [Purpureocillium lilacinum]|uniref:Uncharacterized protein n=1 Tax=Purpureocillium lilacinum TaxID=33203 RepID=A0ACC4ECB7_PURLI
MLSVIVLQGLLLAVSAAVAATTSTTSAPEDVDDHFGRLQAHSAPHCSIWRAYHGGAHKINDLMAALERNNTYEYKPIEIDVESRQKLFVSQYIYMLNDWFRPANISFTLRDSETVVDAKGGCGKDLNIYFGSPYRYGDHVNGALAPRNLSDTMVLPDGIFLQNTGTWASSPVAVQMTAVWLGLLHPVEDFCSEAGDRVDDTPATPLHCFEDFARCPSKNVMAFGDMSEGFTPGQIRRMHTLWNYFRANKTCPPAGHGSRPRRAPSSTTSGCGRSLRKTRLRSRTPSPGAMTSFSSRGPGLWTSGD